MTQVPSHQYINIVLLMCSVSGLVKLYNLYTGAVKFICYSICPLYAMTGQKGCLLCRAYCALRDESTRTLTSATVHFTAGTRKFAQALMRVLVGFVS